MKKTFLFLVAVCTLCACSNQEDLVNYDENQNSSKLITLSSQDKESVKSLQFEVKNAIKNSINIGVASDQLWNRELVLKKIND